MKEIKISIIIPVYNVEKYLVRCLESAINQTWENIEVIVIDDASPDNCRDIINQYEEKFPDLIKAIYLEENLCQGGARNRGLEIATGDYIIYLDSDDYIHETMCEKLILEAQKTDADIVYCDVYRIFENDSKQIWSSYQFMEEMGKMTEKKRMQHILNYGYVWAKLIRTELLKENHIVFPEHRKYEDFAFMPLVILYSQKTAYIKEPLYYYTIRECSVMTTRNNQHHKDIAYMGDFVFKECQRRGFNKYANILKAIAYYKAVKNIIDKNDEPDKEFIYNLANDIYKIYHPVDKKLYLAHDLLEIQIMEAAKKSKEDLSEKIKEKCFVETNVDYSPFYNIFRDEICGIFKQYVGKKIAVWGYGKKGKCLLDVFHSCGILLEYVIDKNREIQGMVLKNGEKIVKYEDICNKIDVIIVVNRNYFSAIETEIKSLNDKIEICNLEARFMEYV